MESTSRPFSGMLIASFREGFNSAPTRATSEVRGECRSSPDRRSIRSSTGALEAAHESESGVRLPRWRGVGVRCPRPNASGLLPPWLVDGDETKIGRDEQPRPNRRTPYRLHGQAACNSRPLGESLRLKLRTPSRAGRSRLRLALGLQAKCEPNQAHPRRGTTGLQKDNLKTHTKGAFYSVFDSAP